MAIVGTKKTEFGDFNNTSLHSSANEDGVCSRGPAGGGDCCVRDRDPTDHAGPDRHAGTGDYY